MNWDFEVERIVGFSDALESSISLSFNFFFQSLWTYECSKTFNVSSSPIFKLTISRRVKYIIASIIFSLSFLRIFSTVHMQYANFSDVIEMVEFFKLYVCLVQRVLLSFPRSIRNITFYSHPRSKYQSFESLLGFFATMSLFIELRVPLLTISYTYRATSNLLTIRFSHVGWLKRNCCDSI